MPVRLTPSGGWAGLAGAHEDRALPSVYTPSAPSIYSAPATLPSVTTANALGVTDAYACVRVLADSLGTLPLHVYRRTSAGRIAAGEDSRAVQLLRRPSPGSTGVDLVSQIVVHLNVHGDCFIGSTAPTARSCSSV